MRLNTEPAEHSFQTHTRVSLRVRGVYPACSRRPTGTAVGNSRNKVAKDAVLFNEKQTIVESQNTHTNLNFFHSRYSQRLQRSTRFIYAGQRAWEHDPGDASASKGCASELELPLSEVKQVSPSGDELVFCNWVVLRP